MLALNAQYANSADRGLSESGWMVIVVFAAFVVTDVRWPGGVSFLLRYVSLADLPSHSPTHIWKLWRQKDWIECTADKRKMLNIGSNNQPMRRNQYIYFYFSVILKR